MNKIILALCALCLGTATAQTFNQFEDFPVQSQVETFHFNYAGQPQTTTQPLRFFACVWTSEPLANLSLTWSHNGITVTRPIWGMNSWGVRAYQADVEDLAKTSTAGDWALSVETDVPVVIQNWGVALAQNQPLVKQYCPTHFVEGAITFRAVVDGGVAEGRQIKHPYIVYSHLGNIPGHPWIVAHSWTNWTTITMPAAPNPQPRPAPAPARAAKPAKRGR